MTVGHRMLVVAAAVVAAGCKDNSTTGLPPLPACTAAASTVSLAAGAYTAFDATADAGCLAFAANASKTDSAEYLVVLQSAGGTPGDSAALQIRTDLSRTLPVAALGTQLTARNRSAVQRSFDRFLRARARQRTVAAPGSAPGPRLSFAPPARTTPPVSGSLRTFTVCANLTCSAYKNVSAMARGVGAHVAIYVDTLAPANGLAAADINTLEQVFDTRLYPIDTLAFGREPDTDTNGVVIVLLTPAVNAMVTSAACTSSGFVLGFFDSVDLDPSTAAQHNHGEVFFGIVPDPVGTVSCAHSTAEVLADLPPTFLHEFEHMISYTQHVLVRGSNPEDDWLDEGLAKYAEELGGDSYLPGDTASFSNYVIDALFDADEYLLAPAQHFLLTTSDQNAGDVGAGWLFVRYLADLFGQGITAKLIRTPLTGTANVAAQTGVTFAALDERWALANYVSDLPGFTAPGELRYSSWSFRGIYASLYQQDPVDFPRPFPLVPTVVSAGSINVAGSLRAGTGVYLRVLQAPGGGAVTLHLNAGTAPLPSTFVPQFAVIRLR
jgi:hypothetical protein